MLRRHEISDMQWKEIKDHLPGKEGDPGATAKDNRLFINAIFWIAKTGAPWRDLPERFGLWNSVFQRFNRWCQSGVFTKIMDLLKDPDVEILMMDSTVIRAHQHAAGAKGSSAEAESLGRSRGGFSTKIHLSCNGVGEPLKIILTPGQNHDVKQAQPLLEGSDPEMVLADKGYDSDELVAAIEAQGAEAVIPPRSNRLEPREYDKETYKQRNIVERMINVMKHCRRVATRYEKTARNFLGIVAFSCIVMLLT
jgi:transposase